MSKIRLRMEATDTGWRLQIPRPSGKARTSLRDRYPHGVLTEQEGGVPNDAENYDEATHVCRKHRRRERICSDAPSRHRKEHGEGSE